MPFDSPEKRKAWEQEYKKRPEVRARQQEYQAAYKTRLAELQHEQAARENKARRGKPRMLKCPHCARQIELPDNSTFVLKRGKVGGQFATEDYKSDPAKEYKRPEAERRRQLAWYWKNREKVLARLKIKRARIRELLSRQ